MTAEKVIICCDRREQLIAECIQQYLKKVRKNNSAKIEINTNPKEGNVVLLLCSPYSIVSSPTIHSVSGMIDYIHVAQEELLTGDNPRQEKITIIPVCFSGLTTTQLPVYMVVNQSIVIGSEDEMDDADLSSELKELKRKDRFDRFGWVLCKTLNRHFKKSEFLETGENEKCSRNVVVSFYKYWCDCWKKLECLPKGSESSDKGPKKDQFSNAIGSSAIAQSFIKVNIKRRSPSNELLGSSSFAEFGILKEYPNCVLSEKESSPSQWRFKIRELSDFCKLRSDEFAGRVSIGIQPFIWDSENLYLGLGNTNGEHYHSGTQDLNTDHRLQNIESQLSRFDSMTNLLPNGDEIQSSSKELGGQLLRYIKLRLESCGHQLWELDLPGFQNPEFCIVLLNDSDDWPRLDIGIIRIIDFAQELGKFNGVDRLAKEIKLDGAKLGGLDFFNENWIWAKDGRIRYWYFNDSHKIPSYIHNAELMLPFPNRKVLVNDSYLFKHHGLCQAATPYTSDEDRYDDDLSVAESFTVSARSMLICF